MRLTLTTLLLAAALAAGAFAAYVDTRPGWDDTGITAGGLFIAAAALSFMRPRLALLIAIAVGGWIPLIEIPRSGNAGALLAVGIALIGALCGAGFRMLVAPGGGSATVG